MGRTVWTVLYGPGSMGWTVLGGDGGLFDLVVSAGSQYRAGFRGQYVCAGQ